MTLAMLATNFAGASCAAQPARIETHSPSNSIARCSAVEHREATPMSEQLEAARRFYAEELRFTARLRSPALVEAFATVPAYSMRAACLATWFGVPSFGRSRGGPSL
jgi:hypothetical protein